MDTKQRCVGNGDGEGIVAFVYRFLAAISKIGHFVTHGDPKAREPSTVNCELRTLNALVLCEQTSPCIMAVGDGLSTKATNKTRSAFACPEYPPPPRTADQRKHLRHSIGIVVVGIRTCHVGPYRVKHEERNMQTLPGALLLELPHVEETLIRMRGTSFRYGIFTWAHSR